MKKICDRIKYWGQLLLLPVYGISFLIPRDRKLWLFGSSFGKRFADNPRYFYQYCVKNREKLNIRPVWISRDKEIVRQILDNGFEAYYYHSLRGIYCALAGKVYLYDNYSKDINFWQSGGAIKVNMWHGIPLKKIQADNVHDMFRNPRNMWERWKNLPRNLSDEKPSDYVLTTSENLRDIFSSAFRTENVITCGYPRTDYLTSDDTDYLLMPKDQEELEAVKSFLVEPDADIIKKESSNNADIAKKESSNNKSKSKTAIFVNKPKAKIVCYMPTFRDSEVKFFEVMDLKRFHKFLQEEEILFCVKLHPKSKLRREFAVALDKGFEGKGVEDKGFENILLLDADSDPYVILKIADVLVTDYSSVSFDFLLLDRPVVFFDYDREEYITKSREMYFDYEEMTPGEKAETMDGLIRALGNALRQAPEYDTKYSALRQTVRDKVFDAQGELASQKLAEKIKKLAGG